MDKVGVRLLQPTHNTVCCSADTDVRASAHDGGQRRTPIHSVRNKSKRADLEHIQNPLAEQRVYPRPSAMQVRKGNMPFHRPVRRTSRACSRSERARLVSAAVPQAPPSLPRTTTTCLEQPWLSLPATEATAVCKAEAMAAASVGTARPPCLDGYASTTCSSSGRRGASSRVSRPSANAA